ncbi:MAG TPA: hypothetical protein ENK63_06165 [Rhodobacterales bacterium]|nr:hypothetical protein [Rhodobacterales bacterium]
MSNASPHPHRILSLVAGLFGAVTIFAASMVLFGPGAALAGHTVALVLWVNLALGPVYILAAILLWRGHRGARPLAFAIAALTGLAALGFALAALRGAPVEPRTAGALALRIGFWLVFALRAPRGAA